MIDEDLYELSDNLRLQLVVLELEDKVNKYMYDTQKENIKKKYRILRIAKFIIVFLYSILAFFEKPIHCYKSTTFYTNNDKNDNECNQDLVYLNNIFFDVTLYRYIEVAFLVSFVLFKIIHFKLKKIDIFKKINLYSILQYIVFILIISCLIDIFLSIFLDYFPLINFFCRGILIILLIKSQRQMWAIVFKIFYRTRVLTFLIFCVMIFFGIIGYFLFGNKSENFSNVGVSIYSLFILLSTCNFPDVMLGTFRDDNKYPFFYFLIYLAINYFILFTLLKTLYYSNFFDSLKEGARKAIEFIYKEFRKNRNGTIEEDENDALFGEEEEKEEEEFENKNETINDSRNERKASLLVPEESQTFNKILFNLNKKFYLTKNDNIQILKLIGYEGKLPDFTKNGIYLLLNQKESRTTEEISKIIQSNKFLMFFTYKYTEVAINFIDFSIMMILLIEIDDENSNFVFVFITQFIWCCFFIFEFIIYIKYLSFRHILFKEFALFCFFILNCFTILFLILSFIFLEVGNKKVHTILLNIAKVFVCLRMLRIFFLFNKYNTFETFYRTFRNMKKIFYSLFSTLFSFFYIFTTITIFLTGGHITKDIFAEDPAIPREYSYVNFNDFGNGFISCFCLTMINNINIISKSLSAGCSSYYQGYFALFYFLSTLVILNISTTLLLEMYMSIKAKMKEVNNKDKRNESSDEEMPILE